MRLEIVGLFAEVQQLTSVRDRVATDLHFHWTWERRTPKCTPPKAPVAPSPPRASRATLAAMRPDIGVSQCPLCGGVLEHREGNPRPTHIGVCSM